jgi:amidase
VRHDAVTLAGMLRCREVSAREVISAHIARVETVDGSVNALVTRTFDAALARAASTDEALASRRPVGLLHGLPVAHKDLADTAGCGLPTDHRCSPTTYPIATAWW